MFKALLFFFLIFNLAQAQEDSPVNNDEISSEPQAFEAEDSYNQEDLENANFDEGSEDEVNKGFAGSEEQNTIKPELSEDEILIEQIESLNEINEGNFLLRPFIYNQRGRRDPFTPIVTDRAAIQQNNKQKKTVLPGLEKYRIDSFTLTSILWSVDKPKALVIDPEKKVHLITKNSRIGTKNGYVVDIKEGSVIVLEEEKDEEGKSLFTTQVLKMGR